MHLIRALKDCKQRSLSVSKKAPTVSKKTAPVKNGRPGSKNPEGVPRLGDAPEQFKSQYVKTIAFS